MVFDNGGIAGYGAPNPTAPTGNGSVRRISSRVLEINTVTFEKIWQYSIAGTKQITFFSQYVSSAQRLPNGNYQMTEYIRIEGTVQQIHWINPHSWIYLDVIDDQDQTVVWALEGANVAALRRRGWAEDSIQAGDTISVRCHQLRDGSNGCLLGYITTEGGVELLFD